MAGLDDADDRTLGVAPRDDRASARGALSMIEHPAMELTEALAPIGIARIAQCLPEGDGVFPNSD